MEVKDINSEKGLVVLQFSTYGSLDRDGDRSNKGMFTKSVKESFSDVRTFVNHDKNLSWGKPLRVWDDEKGAYSETKASKSVLGQDTLIMIDEEVIQDVSFGFDTKGGKTKEITNKGRDLLEVKLWEYSPLTHWGAHPASGVISVTKSFSPVQFSKAMSQEEQDVFLAVAHSDNMSIQSLVNLWISLDTSSGMYSWLGWHIAQRLELTQSIRSELRWNPAETTVLKAHIQTMEKFVRDTKASDDCIKEVQQEIKNAKLFLLELDTAYTGVASQPSASDRDWSSLAKQLLTTN